jgi:flagellar biosynthetic protein FlhB
VSDQSEQNRSEQPTQFKLERARRKGAVARGMDLGFLTGLGAFLAFALLAGGGLVDQVVRASRAAFVVAPNVLGSPNAVLAVTGAVLAQAIRPLAFMAATIFLAVLLFEMVQIGGPVFSTEPLRLDFGKLSPAKGFKRVFSFRMLVETGKNILKLAVYSAIAWLVIRQGLRLAQASVTDAASLTAAMRQSTFRLLGFFVAAAVAFAAIDQLIVRREFLKQMRMSRREIRRESRDREGEPRLKQKRKQMHAEFVKASQSLRGVRGADLMITNPNHYAVALKYDPRTMEAPLIVAQGANQFAQRLKRLGFQYGVVIVPSPELARALYFGGRLNQAIPEGLYRRVADVYLAVRRRASERAAERAGA